MAIPTFTKSGTKATTPAKLDKTIFGVSTDNHELLKAAYVAYLSNGRTNLAVTKTRGLVRGGGKKPWKQKGTGRARFGSSRVPLWRGGGITFGPTGQENYKVQLNTKSKRLAVKQALSLASSSDKILVIDEISSKSGKTVELNKLLNKIGANRNTLIVVDVKSSELLRAVRNLPQTQVVSAKYVNVYDVLNADCVIFTQASLKMTTEWLKTTPPSIVEAK
ncbi:MAG TPA: 50S ribosomal protein L4 [Candidatus Saccharimonadales bacterium]|nr:50S ribosomal protein L4 [Candidatus Saccharimonadales bacterium]